MTLGDVSRALRLAPFRPLVSFGYRWFWHSSDTVSLTGLRKSKTAKMAASMACPHLRHSFRRPGSQRLPAIEGRIEQTQEKRQAGIVLAVAGRQQLRND